MLSLTACQSPHLPQFLVPLLLFNHSVSLLFSDSAVHTRLLAATTKTAADAVPLLLFSSPSPLFSSSSSSLHQQANVVVVSGKVEALGRVGPSPATVVGLI